MSAPLYEERVKVPWIAVISFYAPLFYGWRVEISETELTIGFGMKCMRKTIDRSLIQSVAKVGIPCDNLGIQVDCGAEKSVLHARAGGPGVRVMYQSKGSSKRKYYTFNAKDPDKVIQALCGGGGGGGGNNNKP